SIVIDRCVQVRVWIRRRLTSRRQVVQSFDQPTLHQFLSGSPHREPSPEVRAWAMVATLDEGVTKFTALQAVVEVVVRLPLNVRRGVGAEGAAGDVEARFGYAHGRKLLAGCEVRFCSGR